MINVHFITCFCKEDTTSKIAKLFTRGIREMTGIAQAQTVVIPSHATHDNIYAYNLWLKKMTNPSHGVHKFSVGDRVVQLINSPNIPCTTVTNRLDELMADPYALNMKDPVVDVYSHSSRIYNRYGVYSGEEGTVIDVNDEREIVRVFFDNGYIADYRFGPEARSFDFSYATSLQRHQGKTHQAVILDAWQMFTDMINVNYMNALINSAEKELYILGDNLSLDALMAAINENENLMSKIKVCNEEIHFPIW